MRWPADEILFQGKNKSRIDGLKELFKYALAFADEALIILILIYLAYIYARPF